MRYVLTVGSRDTPDDVLTLMVYLGWYFTQLGVGISSGDAEGADRAFWYGSTQAENYYDGINRIYLAKEGSRGRHTSEGKDFLNAQNYETYEEAKLLALKARGSFNGLNEWGIGMHVRNIFQVLGHSLKHPARCMFYYGIPTGKTEKVKGGTNTALQLAKQSNILPRINLYYPENVTRACNVVKRYNPPDLNIDWKFIKRL